MQTGERSGRPHVASLRFGRPVLPGALTLGPLMFAALLLGQSLTRQFEGVASLYTYFAATIVIFAFVLLMRPYRPMHWLSSLGARDGA